MLNELYGVRDELHRLMSRPSDELVGVIVLAILAVTLVGSVAVAARKYYLHHRRLPKKEGDMSKQGRKDYVKRQVSDAFNAAVDKLVDKRKITAAEGNYWLNRTGKALNLKDLINTKYVAKPLVWAAKVDARERILKLQEETPPPKAGSVREFLAKKLMPAKAS